MFLDICVVVVDTFSYKLLHVIKKEYNSLEFMKIKTMLFVPKSNFRVSRVF